MANEEVDYFPADPAKARLGVAALGAKSFVALNPDKIGTSFGGIARPNPFKRYGNSRLEGVPHGSIHNYVGGDMGDFATAARDPIFFAHHGNLDRLWEIWRQDPEKRKTEPSLDEDFMRHEFPFVWIDGTTVTVSVRETFDTAKLGYAYDTLDVMKPRLAEMFMPEDVKQALPPIATSQVSIPRGLLSVGPGPARYDLLITGIQSPERAMTVGVYLKAAKDQAAGPGTPVGSFAAVRTGGSIGLPENDLQFDVTDFVERAKSSDFSVTLVPLALGGDRAPYRPLKYETMRIRPSQ